MESERRLWALSIALAPHAPDSIRDLREALAAASERPEETALRRRLRQMGSWDEARAVRQAQRERE